MVWLRVLNLPKVLRTYDVLWAVGTMFGATQKVDMITTRKNKFGRFKVAVLNPAIVPTRMDCVIGTLFFELQFEIEPFVPSGETTESGTKEGTEGDGSGNRDGDTEMEDANKKAKQSDPSASKGSKQPENSAAGQPHDVESFVEDFDDDDLLDDVGEVLAGNKMVQQADAGSNALHKEELAAMVQGKATVQASHAAGGLEVEKEMAASAGSPSKPPSLALGSLLERAIMGLKEANGGVASGGVDGLATGDLGEVTPLKTVLAGSVQSPPLRRSKPREGTADEDSTARAAKLVAKRNLEVDEGKLYNNSFLSFSDEHISDK